MGSIRAAGREYPSVKWVETFRPDFTHRPNLPHGGLDLDIWKFQGYPWHYYASDAGAGTGLPDPNNLGPGQFHVRRQDSTLNRERWIKVVPQPSNEQTMINGELQCYLKEYEWAQYGTPSLARHTPQNTLLLEAIHAPAEHKDNFLGIMPFSYVVTAIDQASGMVTIQGNEYFRRRQTNARPDGSSRFLRGWHHGFDNSLRDQLRSDVQQLDNDRPQYDYGFMRHRFNNTNMDYRYDAVIGDDAPNVGDDSNRQYNEQPIMIHMMDWPLGIAVGDRLQPKRHFPWVAPMLTSCESHAQIYGAVDVTVKLHRHRYQFSAAWLWANERREGLDGKSDAERNELAKFYNDESDIVEWPGGTRMFHNWHEPSEFDMKNFADRNGWPSIAGGDDWNESRKHQTIDLIEPDHPHYMDPTEFVTYRHTTWPPGNELGYPAGTRTTDVLCKDGVFRMKAGCVPSQYSVWDITKPEQRRPFEAQQLFLNGAVGGEFVADMEYFAADRVNTNEAPPIRMEVSEVVWRQFEGWPAGGSALPDQDGFYPLQFRAHPKDTTGNSGIGIVPESTEEPMPKTIDEGVAVIGYEETGEFDNQGRPFVRPVT